MIPLSNVLTRLRQAAADLPRSVAGMLPWTASAAAAGRASGQGGASAFRGEPVPRQAVVPEEHSALLDGTRVRWFRYPARQPESGLGARPPRVVMVHGFRGDHHGLSVVAEAMAQRWEVVVPDLPGFGRSEPYPDREHTSDAYAATVLELIRHLGPDPVLLLGHSFGSVVATRAAASPGAPVLGLVLVNPICEPALDSANRWAAVAASVFYRLCAVLPSGSGDALVRSRVVTRVSSELMAKTVDPDLRRWINGQHDAYFGSFASRAVVLEAYESSIRDTVTDAAADVACPVLLVAAERDDLGSVAGQQELAEAFADARLEILPGAGHLVHYELPGRAAGMADGFAEELLEDLAAAPDPAPHGDSAGGSPAGGTRQQGTRGKGTRKEERPCA